MNLIIDFNKTCLKDNRPEDVMSQKRIVGDLTAFLFAGFDTSFNASVSTIIAMMQEKNKIWVEKIRNSGVQTSAECLENSPLDVCLKEGIRLYGPVPSIFGRIVTKDMTLAGVTIEKGNKVVIPLSFSKYRSEYHDAEDFMPERWEDKKAVEKLGGYTYLPFYTGKRGCLGRIAGEFNMKLMVGNILKRFELKLEDGYQMVMELDGAYACKNPDVLIRLRRKLD